MADNTNLSAAVNDIGRFSNDYSAASRSGSTTFRSLAAAATNLIQTSKEAASAAKDSSESLSKFNKTVESAAKTISSLAGNSTKFGVAVGSATKIVSSGITSFLEVTDNILKLNDTLASYGVVVEHTSIDIIDIANGAGYWSGNADKFAQQVAAAGTNLLALSPTTGKAVKRFKQIFNVSQIKGGVEAIMKLGYTPETFNKAQVDYIKLQSAYGLQIEASDKTVRDKSMEYALTISKLSALTGETKDEISQKMASQALDFKYQLERRRLVESGNEKAALELDKATGLVNSLLGPDITKGLNDMIANGTATTKEGESVMMATNNQAATWARKVKAGEMTGVEYARKVSTAYGNFIQTNKEALRVSEDFRKQVYITGKTLTGIDLGVGMADDATVDKLIKQSQVSEDKLKKTQSELYEAERNKNIAMDKMATNMAGGMVDAFKIFTNYVVRIAYGAAGLGKVLSPEGSDAEKAFQKVQDILGDAEDGKKSLSKVSSELKENDEAIKKHGKYTEDYLKYSDQYNKSVAKKNDLLKKKEKGEKIDEKALQEYVKAETESWTQITAILSREKKMFGGVTSQTLIYKKKYLIERKQELETVVKVKVEEAAVEERAAKYKEERAKALKDAREGKVSVEPGKQSLVDKSMYGGLNFKDIEEGTWGGAASTKLIEAAKFLQNMFKDKGFEITAMDDKYHRVKKPKSLHTKGIAMDFVLRGNEPKNAKESLEIKKKLKELGIFADVRDEYFTQRDDGTNPHFHVQVPEFKTGGISTGPKTGYKAELHGTEAIIPMPDNKTVPIQLKIPDRKDDFSDAKQGINYRLTALKDVKLPDIKTQRVMEQYDDSAEFQLVNTLLDKIQLMTRQFEKSNSIQSNLKVYLHN